MIISEMTNTYVRREETDFLEGLMSPELEMVKKLAGNDEKVRKNTMKKLKRWLQAISSRVEDTPDSSSLIEANIMRVHKALFYCMWMADKPMPQENLAEKISDLVFVFRPKLHAYILFFEWFVRTYSREWPWIDKFRRDKFMMLFRRFLRKVFTVASEKKWKNDVSNGISRVISYFVFNRHPSFSNVKSRKKNTATTEQPIKSPVGMQMHFISIFLEELAKVGGDGDLKSPKLLKLLLPFIHEVAHNRDERIVRSIQEHIFHHLIYQSDAAAEYRDGLSEMNYDNYPLEQAQDVEANGKEDNEHLEEMEINSELDPRAGGVDVILPQLDIQYQSLAESILQAGKKKDVPVKNRRILYDLAMNLREVERGNYPFKPDDSAVNTFKAFLGKRKMDKAVEDLVSKNMSGISLKPRKTKKQRKRQAKKLINVDSSLDSIDENDGNEYLQDAELLEHPQDNFLSYLEECCENKENKSKESIKSSSDTTFETVEGPVTSKLKKKLPKKLKKSDKTEEVQELPKSQDNVKQTGSSDTVLVFHNKKTKKNYSVKSDAPLKKLVRAPLKLKKKKTTSMELSTQDLINSLNQCAIAKEGPSGMVPESPASNNVKAITPKSCKTPRNNFMRAHRMSAGKKRVSFVLAKNSEQEMSEYRDSIEKNPAIPFHADKKPLFGLLKSPKPGESPLSSRKVLFSPRMSAKDFF